MKWSQNMKNDFLKKNYWILLQSYWKTNDDSCISLEKMSISRLVEGIQFEKVQCNNNGQMMITRTLSKAWMTFDNEEWLLMIAKIMSTTRLSKGCDA